MEHYLDNASTTKLLPEVSEEICRILQEDYGNPSSLHRKGQAAEKIIKNARQSLSHLLDCETAALYFTSCATESITTALQGSARRLVHFGRHILTSQGEHAAVRENLKELRTLGFEIEYVQNDPQGRILPEDVMQKLRPDTILVSLIHINNETGALSDLTGIGAELRKRSPHGLFHVDATQSFGKYSIPVKALNIDLLSASAHKIHGPKGIGLLYKSRRANIPPLILGGSQEGGFRSGTENTAYIAGFARAAELYQAHQTEYRQTMMGLKRYLWEAIREIPDIRINGPSIEEGAAHILNLWIQDVRAEVLLHSLEDREIYIGSGSACSANKPAEKGSALAALGLKDPEIDSSIRISLSCLTTQEDVEVLAASLKELVPQLRRFTRR